MQSNTDRETQPYWNLFAWQLSRILALRGVELEQLVDHIEIQSYKVHRLVQSLKTPAHLPVFDPSEIRVVKDAFHLSQEEMVHLQAAILATSIQRMLCDCVNQNAARQSTAQIFPLLVQAVAAQVVVKGTGDVHGDESPAEDNVHSLALDAAIDADDRGTDAFQRSVSARSYMEQVRLAKQSREHYQAALSELGSLSSTIQQMPGWGIIRNEVLLHLERVEDRLEKLGEDIL